MVLDYWASRCRVGRSYYRANISQHPLGVTRCWRECLRTAAFGDIEPKRPLHYRRRDWIGSAIRKKMASRASLALSRQDVRDFLKRYDVASPDFASLFCSPPMNTGGASADVASSSAMNALVSIELPFSKRQISATRGLSKSDFV